MRYDREACIIFVHSARGFFAYFDRGELKLGGNDHKPGLISPGSPLVCDKCVFVGCCPTHSHLGMLNVRITAQRRAAISHNTSTHCHGGQCVHEPGHSVRTIHGNCHVMYCRRYRCMCESWSPANCGGRRSRVDQPSVAQVCDELIVVTKTVNFLLLISPCFVGHRAMDVSRERLR